MKNLLSKKLYAFVMTAFLFSAGANAQIVYTDINPDISRTRTAVTSTVSVLTTEENIDVNNDGTPDLKFTLTSSRLRGRTWGPNPVPGPGGNPPANPFPTGPINGNVSVTPLNGGAILSGSSGYPGKMNLNESINASATWSTTPSQILVSKSSNVTNPLGNWNTASDGFLGLKLISGNKTYYCWIRLNVAAFSSGENAATLVLKDFAYNSRRRSPILAGQTATIAQTTTTPAVPIQTSSPSMAENLSSSSSIALYPNPAVNQFTIDLGDKDQKVGVTISDMKGTMIYSTTATQKLEVNTTDFKDGIYIVQFQSADFIGTKRLIISK